MVILHLDADVADKSYANYGIGVVQMAQEEALAPLPCSSPCPPASDTIENLKIVLLSWLGIANIGGKSAFCIPSKSSEAWLAVAVFPDNANLLQGIECNNLAQLPMNQRIKKSQMEYKRHASKITKYWLTIRQICSQADIFHHDVDTIAKRIAQ